jgi:ATP-dependent DNA ligase
VPLHVVFQLHIVGCFGNSVKEKPQGKSKGHPKGSIPIVAPSGNRIYLAQIEFTEWTPDGHLRHSKFVGLREDKAAREVVREG